MYVLHYAPDNASLIIRLALEHRALPYRTQLVDRATQQQRSAAYLRINPNGLIPALETPQGVIFETGAILLWLADRHANLAPSPTDEARGDFLKWFFFTANTVHPALRMLFYPQAFVGSDPNAQAALRSKMQQDLTRCLRQLDEIARSEPGWFGGASVGSLDFYVGAILRWCALYPTDQARDWFNLSDYPALSELCKTLDDLPCTSALQAAEGMADNPFSDPSYPSPPEGSAT